MSSSFKSFEELAELATKQREIYKDLPRQKLLRSIEKALLERKLPDLAEISIPIDVSDSLLNELFKNETLMKELKVYLVCKTCNDGVRPFTPTNILHHIKRFDNAKLIRICKECHDAIKDETFN